MAVASNHLEAFHGPCDRPSPTNTDRRDRMALAKAGVATRHNNTKAKPFKSTGAAGQQEGGCGLY